jgi:hypothetical protein
VGSALFFCSASSIDSSDSQIGWAYKAKLLFFSSKFKLLVCKVYKSLVQFLDFAEDFAIIFFTDFRSIRHESTFGV